MAQSEASADPNSRVTDLEIKLTYLEETTQELNQVVFRQQQSMEKMEKTVKALQARIEELEENNHGGNLPHEKPPHY